MSYFLTTKPYNLNMNQSIEAHFSTMSLEDLRVIQAKREKEEAKLDLEPELAFMANDKEKLDKLIASVVVDTVGAKRKVGRPKKK